MRRQISAWKALVWAYRTEKVHCATNSSLQTSYARTGFWQSDYGSRPEGGLINGVLDAHEDAVTIDGKLADWCGADYQLRQAVIAAAESDRQPPRREQLRPLRVLAERDLDGRAIMVYPSQGRHEPIACCIVYDGIEARMLERLAHVREMFDGFLGIMPGFQLSKWVIETP